MILSLANHVNRIDRDRESLRRTLHGRLARAARTLAGEARHASDPVKVIQRSDALANVLARQAMIARLTGMWRAIRSYEATGRTYVRPMQLNRAKEDRDDKALILWLIRFNGLNDSQVQTLQGESIKIGQRAAEAITTPVMKRIEQAIVAGKAASTPVVGIQSDTGVFGKFGKANILDLPEHDPRSIGVAFDKAGAGRINDHLIETWAETVTYSEYERGRDDIHKTPQVNDVLWGYRWDSTIDERTTTGCRHLNGWVAPKDDRWMAALMPPRHFGCRSVIIPVYKSSALSKPPTPIPPKASEADLGRYLDEKLKFIGYVNPK